MKSRKLRAVLAALSAIAVLATAMTGFAATVTTTTEYRANDDYVHVVSTVTGANGDVTYLATTSDDMGVNSTGILYIDQKATLAGTVTFDYMVAKDAIDGAVTSLVLGTNGSEAIEPSAGGIGLYSTANVDEERYTITYSEDIYGNSDGNVTALIEAKNGYEIVRVLIDGVEVPTVDNFYDVPVNKNNGSLKPVVVETIKTDVTPSMGVVHTRFAKEGNDHTATTIFKPVGTYNVAGVKYGGFDFIAMSAPNDAGFVAVKIVDDDPFYEDGLVPYVE